MWPLLDPLIALPLIALPLVALPLIALPLIALPLVVLPLAADPLPMLPLVTLPVVDVPLPGDPPDAEAPDADPALEPEVALPLAVDPLASPLLMVEPVALPLPPTVYADPPHEASAGAASDARTAPFSAFAISDALMIEHRSNRYPPRPPFLDGGSALTFAPLPVLALMAVRAGPNLPEAIDLVKVGQVQRAELRVALCAGVAPSEHDLVHALEVPIPRPRLRHELG